jgi:hypothetical protein
VFIFPALFLLCFFPPALAPRRDARARQSCYEVHQIISWSNPEAAAEAAARQCNRALGDAVSAFGCGGYVNTNSDDGGGGGEADDAQMQLLTRLYGGNARRLLEIKKAYDPDNLFHHNSNIREAAGDVAHVTMHD